MQTIEDLALHNAPRPQALEMRAFPPESRGNAANWNAWALPPQLESRLISLGLQGPGTLGLLAVYLLDLPSVLAPLSLEGYVASRLEHAIEEHLRENMFVSPEAVFQYRLCVTDHECQAVWAVEDGCAYARSLVTFEGTDGEDLLTFIRESPERIKVRWEEHGFVQGRLLHEIPEKVSSILGQLPEHERFVVSQRLGLAGDGVPTLEELGTRVGVTREWIRQIEAKAIKKLRHPTRSRQLRDGYAYLSRLARRLGCDLRSQEFTNVVYRLTGGQPTLTSGTLALLVAIFQGKDGNDLPSLAAFDQSVLFRLAQQIEPLSADHVVQEVLQNPAAAKAVAQWPELDPVARIRHVLGGGVDEKRMCWLSNPNEVALPSRLKRLSATIRVLRRATRSLHFEEVWQELQKELPDHLALDSRNVHAWLDRNKDLFRWVGPGTYALAEWDMGHRAVELDPALLPARRKGIGDEVVALLLETGGPLNLEEIEDWILNRFAIKENSVLATIQQDKARRFVLLAAGRVGLAGRDDADESVPVPKHHVRIPPEVAKQASQRAGARMEDLRDALGYRLSTLSDQELVRYAVLASCLGMPKEFSSIDTIIPERGLLPSMRLAMKEML